MAFDVKKTEFVLSSFCVEKTHKIIASQIVFEVYLGSYLIVLNLQLDVKQMANT